MSDTAAQINVAFSMQVDVESRGSVNQTTSCLLSGIGGRAVVRTKLLGQQQHRGRWCYEELEELNMQLQALTLMADHERECVKNAVKKPLQRARDPRGVALICDLGSALGDRDEGELHIQQIKSRTDSVL